MYGIILAGGSGSRLWPLSRELYPKQLLNLISDKSLLQATFERLKVCMPEEDIISITNTKHVSNVKMQLSSLTQNPVVLAEPVAKNTAPAIVLATKYIMQKSVSDPIIIVVPSDHLIKDNEKFLSTVQKGKKLAQDGYIVTFGIKPNYPETGYGYINTSKEIGNGYKVKEFVEKPDFETAQKYLQEGTFYWNSGIFMFKASTLLNEAIKHAPDIAKVSEEFDFTENNQIPFVNFDKMPNISIDYAIMEKSNKIALVKLESDWNDLGSWQSIYDVSKKDKDGNELATYTVYKAFSYSKEYDLALQAADIDYEEKFFKKVAENGGGAYLSDMNEAHYAVFDNFDKTIEKVFDPRYLFMIIAIILFVTEIAVRKFKFKWLHEIIREARDKKQS